MRVVSKKLSDLKPIAATKATAALADLKRDGVPCVVTYTLRTTAEQNALFAQGREPLDTVNAKRKISGLYALSEKENKYTVTNCDGLRHQSRHQTGTALDVVPLDNGRAVWPNGTDPRWQQIASAFKAHGFTWGGDWKDFPDYPHYQL